MERLQFRDAVGGEIHLVGEVADLDSRNHRVQVVFPHERVDTFKTTFGPVAFRESFEARLPVMCWQHDLRDPIGIAESAKVLRNRNEIVSRFSDLEAVPNAKRAFAQLDDGTLSDFSFGFTNGVQVPHPDPQLRSQGVCQITKATMRELSPVTIGSIPGAMATDLRDSGLAVVAAEGIGLITDADTIGNLVRAAVLTPEQGQALLADLVPQLREKLGTIRVPEDAGPSDETVEGTRDWEAWDAEHATDDALHASRSASTPDEHDDAAKAHRKAAKEWDFAKQGFNTRGMYSHATDARHIAALHRESAKAHDQRMTPSSALHDIGRHLDNVANLYSRSDEDTEGTRDWAKWHAEHPYEKHGHSQHEVEIRKGLAGSLRYSTAALIGNPHGLTDEHGGTMKPHEIQQYATGLERASHMIEAGHSPEAIHAEADGGKHDPRHAQGMHGAAAALEAELASLAARQKAGLRTDGGTPMDETRGAKSAAEMCADDAEKSRDDAKAALASGDHAEAKEHAKRARGHYRRAATAANDERPEDASAVERASQAAGEATDLTDNAEERAWSPGQPITATVLQDLAVRAHPEMAELLNTAVIALAPAGLGVLFQRADGAIFQADGEPVTMSGGERADTSEEAAQAAQAVDAALDAVAQWLEGVDVATLPEPVQQALALVQAAGDAADNLLDIMGVPDTDDPEEPGEGERADMTLSEKPWSDVYYSPEQWRRACLIDTGEGAEDSKDRYSLPIREPDGTLNVNGIAAAAGRLNQVKAPEAKVKEAAKELMSLYGKMKKSTPGNVLKVLGQGSRSETEAAEAAARSILDRRLAGASS